MSRTGPPDETIAAVSTPHGRSAIGVVRVSGDTAWDLIDRLFSSRGAARDRVARFGVFKNIRGEALDDVVVTLFRGPRSYTGEDVAEISAHGNPGVLRGILDALIEAGARPADPGEFTLRAVAHGKLDLAEAEALGEFIAAQTERQARTARYQMDGALARRIRPDRETLIGIVAELEAGIDFAEDDVVLPDTAELAGRVGAVAARMETLAGTFRFGRLLSAGLGLAVAGKPNVGKSSLFNALTRSERSIVTEVPGTTRDVVVETAEVIPGIPVRFADTAGVRRSADRVEAIGVERTFEAVAEADLTLVVLDRSRQLDADDARVHAAVEGGRYLVVANKCDLPAAWSDPVDVTVSAKTGDGLDRLRAAIEAKLVGDRPTEADTLVITSGRQADALGRTVESLGAARAALIGGVPHEMVLLDLYAALSALGELTGEVTTDDILDRVFSTFCIGK